MKKTAFGGDKNYFYIAAVILIVHCIIWIFSGNSPFVPNPYNSYVLQAEAWRDGRFDLGQNYSHLELAIYNSKYFVSFPQFPAMVYFLFVLPGIPVPEGIIALAFAIAGGILSYKIAKNCGIDSKISFILSILMTCGSNILFVSTNAWVWFIAQNMCFALTLGAIYCAIKKRAFLCFLLWAFAIGCRPFQTLYFPLLCMLLCGDKKSFKGLIKQPYVFAGAVIVGIFYMWLNFARFGNIFEFGHNYLPEFTKSANGQFHISYLKDNLYSLIRLPKWDSSGMIIMHRFDGMNIFLVSPVLTYAIYRYISNFKTNRSIKTLALITLLIELIFIALHKTMGGWHFGNRYTNDCLPLALVIIAMSDMKKEAYPAGLCLLTLYGVLMNVTGTITCYIN